MLDARARESWEMLGERLHAFIRRRVPVQDADDVLQDVLLRIHQGARQLNDDARFGPWVYAIARNAVIDRARREAAAPIAQSEGLVDREPAQSVDEADGESPLAGCVAPFVARLPTAYREAMTLVEIQGLTQVEAAELSGISLSGMKSRVQRARRLMRQMFEECCDLTIDGRGHVIEAARRDNCDRERC